MYKLPAYMLDKLKTSIEFTKSLLTTGAFKETSRKVEIEITSLLPRDENRTIVEFGIGHGNITREILRVIHPTSQLYAFEVKEEFCEYVAQEIKDPRLTIINDGAEKLLEYVEPPVHGIVSSLPLTLFPKDLRRYLLQNTYEALAEGAYFNQVLYTKVHDKTLRKYFDKVTMVRFLNIPMEYVYHCQKLTAGGASQSPSSNGIRKS